MKIINELNENSADILNKIILDGGVILWPSGGVYGLAADAYDKSAVDKIYKIKKREAVKPLSIISNISTCSNYAYLSGFARFIIYNFWPDFIGVISKKKSIPGRVNCCGEYIALVCSSSVNVWLSDKIKIPLASSSANISGEPEITDWKKAKEMFESDVDAIIISESNNSQLNTLVKIEKDDSYSVVRAGKYSEDYIKELKKKYELQKKSR